MRYPPPVVPGYTLVPLTFAEAGSAQDDGGYTTVTTTGLPEVDPDGYPYVYAGRSLYFYSTKAIDGWQDDWIFLVSFGPAVVYDAANPSASPVAAQSLLDVDDSGFLTGDTTGKAALTALGNGIPAYIEAGVGLADPAGHSATYNTNGDLHAGFQLTRRLGGFITVLPGPAVLHGADPQDPDLFLGGMDNVAVANHSRNSFPETTDSLDHLGPTGPHFVGADIVLVVDGASPTAEHAPYAPFTAPTTVVPVRYVALGVPAPDLLPAQVSAGVTFRSSMSLDGS